MASCSFSILLTSMSCFLRQGVKHSALSNTNQDPVKPRQTDNVEKEFEEKLRTSTDLVFLLLLYKLLGLEELNGYLRLTGVE